MSPIITINYYIFYSVFYVSRRFIKCIAFAECFAEYAQKSAPNFFEVCDSFVFFPSFSGHFRGESASSRANIATAIFTFFL